LEATQSAEDAVDWHGSDILHQMQGRFYRKHPRNMTGLQ
jgi:hypothetical protein